MTIKENSKQLKKQFIEQHGYFELRIYNDWLYDNCVFNEAKIRFLSLSKKQQEQLIKLIN
jgi:hypothetical protein